MTHQFGLTQHLPMAFFTMSSPNSRSSLSSEVKKITNLTQWMLSLFEFHLFLPNPKKATSFLNWWPIVKVVIFPGGFPFYLMQADDQRQVELVVSKTPSQPQPFPHPALIFFSKNREGTSVGISINPLTTFPIGFPYKFTFLDSPIIYYHSTNVFLF